MKRHEALVPLSHDHHEALLVALRLKKGGPASSRDNWPSEAEAQRNALFLFVDRELLPHFLLEEDLLFPACNASTPDIQAIAQELALEHETMRILLNGIRTSDLPPLKEKMKEFGVILEAHVRKEERSFFPLVEEGVKANTLIVDSAALAAGHARYHPPPACDV
jgi:iron-sulfur cluster repair protein YtfE (RIC family)